ncbi:hypothetical protein FQA39_LY15525 [Lamprigera yunnana]|nr:hypothetical protein FQA39_LY15525 [Lamprigera yunnana]
MGDHKSPYCMKKVTNLFSAIKCHLCKNYYHDSCSKRVKTRSDGAFIKCCGDDDILDISDGVSSDVVNGQGDLDFHDASSAIENKLEGTTVTHDDFKQFYINFEKFMNDKLNKYNAIYNKLDNKIDSSNKMLIEQVNKHVSDGIDSIKTVIAKIEQKIEYNEKIVENAVERIDNKTMPGTILENLSGRKLSVLVVILLLCQIACFMLGGFISPSPASSQSILSIVCIDENPSLFSQRSRWLTKNCKSYDLHIEHPTVDLNASNFVFVAKMPLYNVDFSRWQQNLVGVLQIDMLYQTGQSLNKVMDLTLDSKLAYRNNGDRENEWTYLSSSQEKRIIECSLQTKKPKDRYPYSCSTIPLFELGSLHHDYYLLNFRLPVDDKGMNTNVGVIADIYVNIIHMNGGFTKVLLSLKTVFFPILIAIIVWFWKRVHILARTPALLEYLLLVLGLTLAFLNLPLEYLTLYFDMPYMLLLSDIRQGVFYAALLSFWIIFAGEHMLIKEVSNKNSLRAYWMHLSGILIGCLSLLIFDLCERGVQLYNPFYSIWVTPIGTNLALSFIILAGISAGIYFIFLCYMIWKAFKNISIKRSVLPSMSLARRLHYEGIIYRFNFLMLVTLICAAVTIISFILSQIAEGQNKWDENMELELSSALFTGVYGMWNIYIFAMLILYAPSHKQWPTDTLSGDNGEEVEFSRLPTDPCPNEISSLTSFASKVSMD